MALPNKAGTPEKVILFGIPYDVSADCNPTSNFTGVTTEALATSGGVIFKDVAQACYIKGIDLAISVQDYNLLCQMIKVVPKPYPVGLMYSDLTIATFPGAVNLGDHNGADAKATADIYFENSPIVAG